MLCQILKDLKIPMNVPVIPRVRVKFDNCDFENLFKPIWAKNNNTIYKRKLIPSKNQ